MREAGESSSASEERVLLEDSLEFIRERKLQRLAKGEAVYDLSMFNPDLAPPRFVHDKLLEATVKPFNHRYAVSRGIKKLREAFAFKYKQRFEVALDPEDQICVSMGSKDAFNHLLDVLRGSHNRVLLPTPTYPAHLAALKATGMNCAYYSLHEDEGKILSEISKLLLAPGRAVVVLNFPNNPTGMVVSREFYQALFALAEQHDAFLVNDFVYGEMGFGKHPHPSLLSVVGIESRAAEVYSLSKAYSVPGWRVGALLGNSRLVKVVASRKAIADYGLFLPLQIAAAAALSARDDFPQVAVQTYRQRIHTLLSGVTQLGWEAAVPHAGGVLWAKLPDALVASKGDAAALARELLETVGIVLTPGAAFGDAYRNYVRFAAVLPDERLREVLGVLSGFLRGEAPRAAPNYSLEQERAYEDSKPPAPINE